MRHSILSFGSFAVFLSRVSALTIFSPTPGAAVDPTMPIVVAWLSDSSDPSTIDLKIGKTSPDGLNDAQTVATGVSTHSGSFTIPANTIENWGTGYQLQAVDGGTTISQVTDISLTPFSGAASTNSDGQLTIVSQTSAASATGATITASTALQSASGVTILSGTATPEATNTGSTLSSGFVTSSTSGSSSEASAAATTAANTNTANGQMRGSEVVLGAAGVLAGIVALLA